MVPETDHKHNQTNTEKKPIHQTTSSEVIADETSKDDKVNKCPENEQRIEEEPKTLNLSEIKLYPDYIRKL